MNEIENAVIERTHLGFDSNSIFTAILHLKYRGGGQEFGTYQLADSQTDPPYSIVGLQVGMQFIIRVCQVVGVERWEDLPGRHVRADHDSGQVHRIGHLIQDNWFDPADLWKGDAGMRNTKDGPVLTANGLGKVVADDNNCGHCEERGWQRNGPGIACCQYCVRFRDNYAATSHVAHLAKTHAKLLEACKNSVWLLTRLMNRIYVGREHPISPTLSECASLDALLCATKTALAEGGAE